MYCPLSAGESDQYKYHPVNLIVQSANLMLQTSPPAGPDQQPVGRWLVPSHQLCKPRNVARRCNQLRLHLSHWTVGWVSQASTSLFTIDSTKWSRTEIVATPIHWDSRPISSWATSGHSSTTSYGSACLGSIFAAKGIASGVFSASGVCPLHFWSTPEPKQFQKMIKCHTSSSAYTFPHLF